jgi:predicted PurR-regulated permease PerM
VFPRWLVVSIATVLVGLVIYALRGVLTPIFFAFLIAYMLDPVVDRFEAMKLPRAVGIVIVLGVALLFMLLFLLLAVPALVSDIARFASELPPKLADLRAEWEPYLASRGIEVPSSIDEALAEFDVDVRGLAERAVGPAGAVLGYVVGGTASAVGAIAGLALIPVLAFYFLYDFDNMTAAIRDLIPHRVRPFVVDVFAEIDQVLGQFIRGQLTVMLILAVLYSIGYSIAGVRLALLIGIIGGVLSFIPYVGGAVAILLALLMCLLDFQGWSQLVWVGVIYAVVQGLEGFVITPKIMGDQVGLSVIWVLIALMVGGELFGFLGILLAVPAAAVAKILAVRAVAWYRESAFFLAEPDAAGIGALGSILRHEGLPDSTEITEAKRAAARNAAEETEDAPSADAVAPLASSSGDDDDD